MKLMGGYKKPRPRRIFYIRNLGDRVQYSLDAWEVPETRAGLATRVWNWRRKARVEGKPGATKIVSHGRQYILGDGFAPTFYPDGIPKELLDKVNRR